MPLAYTACWWHVEIGEKRLTLPCATIFPGNEEEAAHMLISRSVFYTQRQQIEELMSKFEVWNEGFVYFVTGGREGGVTSVAMNVFF